MTEKETHRIILSVVDILQQKGQIRSRIPYVL